MRASFVFGCLILFATGCTLKHGSYSRGCFTHPPPLVINGETLEVTKANWVKVMGPPTLVIDTADGEVCVWRNPSWAPGLPHGTADFIMTFDENGNFKATEPSVDCGLCRRCGHDLRGAVGGKCPACGG